MPKSSLMIAVVTGVLPDSRKKKEKRTSVDLSTKKVGVLFWSSFSGLFSGLSVNSKIPSSWNYDFLIRS